MENLDVMVLRKLREWRLQGLRAMLVTVVRTWGSSPRPVGSIMALSEQGQVVGSVSGGCIEDDLIDRHTRAYAQSSPPEGASRHDHTIPSGTLELMLEFDPDAASLGQLIEALERGQLMQRQVRLADGAVSLWAADAPAELTVADGVLNNTFGPEYRMLLIGAGQLTEYLATMALFSGFAVTVCDPREEYRSTWRVPGARVVSDMPDDVVRPFQPDRRSCVVALTHDPKLDDLALLEALDSEAFYVGGIGSRRNNEARRARMIEHFDQTEASLARLRGPIGIYIGSKTPPEIAVSVMAEILAVKNGVTLPRDMAVAQAKNEREKPHNDPGAQVCGLPRRAA